MIHVDEVPSPDESIMSVDEGESMLLLNIE